MRDIEYKIWDNKNNKMLSDYTCYWEDHSLNYAFQDDDYIFLQYTGLKDKNGKEIFEGDIVEYNQNFSSDSFIKGLPKVINEIKYIDEYAQFNLDGWFGGDALHKKHNQIEIIGNIYETPNLLN